MKIVIAGAGDVGFHLADLLVKENKNITLIDTDDNVLQYADQYLDVLTVKGNAASLNILQKAEVFKADLFIAVTTSETTNLLSSVLAKKQGAKKTIARVSNVEYLNQHQTQSFNEIGIDYLVAPRLLAAKEILRLIERRSATDVFEFGNGQILIIGFTVDTNSNIIGKTFEQLNKETPDFKIRTICILRDGKTFIPDQIEVVKPKDHIYLVSNSNDYQKVNNYIGKNLKQVKKIMIIGGSNLALQTCQLLENNYSVSVVVEKEATSQKFYDVLNSTTVIQGSVSNVELLKEEGLQNMDAFIALTSNSEINIITSLTAEDLGVYKTIAHVDNSDYTRISQNIGIDTLINKKLIAADDIFRHIRKGKVEAVAHLHGVDAELIEFEITANCKSLNVKCRDLAIPHKKALVAGILRDNKGYITFGNFELQVGDKVIILTLPEFIQEVEKIFM